MSMLKGLTLTAAAMVLTSLQAGAVQGAGGGSCSRPVSLLDTDPEIYYGIKRYPKFYGDPYMDQNTIDGSILKRQYLLGSVDGIRDKLAEHGLILDAGLTQVGQAVAAGDGDGGRFSGSGDLWVALDTGRARLWSGGLIFAHLEGDWGEFIKGTGSLLPLNGDSLMPAIPASVALSELYAYQRLPAGFAAFAGKVDWMAHIDTTFFANEERTQFLYEGLIHNPLLRSFVPYTSLGLAVTKKLNNEVTAGTVFLSNNDNALDAGIENFGLNAVTYGLTVTWRPEFAERPGLYELFVGYSTKSSDRFQVDERYLIDEVTDVVPVAQSGNNYALALNASQFFWVDRSVRRSDGQPVGVGSFFRFGINPDSRNVIERFYSLGFGGNGGMFGRVDDSWGVGWAGTQFSDDFRRGAADLGFEVDSFENAVEAYYNLALMPAVRTSFHVQFIDSANPSRNAALVYAMRLQLDF